MEITTSKGTSFQRTVTELFALEALLFMLWFWKKKKKKKERIYPIPLERRREIVEKIRTIGMEFGSWPNHSSRLYINRQKVKYKLAVEFKDKIDSNELFAEWIQENFYEDLKKLEADNVLHFIKPDGIHRCFRYREGCQVHVSGGIGLHRLMGRLGFYMVRNQDPPPGVFEYKLVCSEDKWPTFDPYDY